ncbi:hypothetical protein [Streptomyces sp. SID4985]|uniref:hypothetical protein n=1 Tax=unclassified Streptomyces TaxID=2593676 RepID=UPI00136B57CC|nr:hypothetical protein [Streptomyces sp. SID4985]MYQ43535.1 hypothetical protein [Streptomyces sp. SID4985]
MTVPDSLSDDLLPDLGSTAHLMSSIGVRLVGQLRDVTPPGRRRQDVSPTARKPRKSTTNG